MANAEREKIARPDLVQVPALRELGVRGSNEIFTLKKAKEEYLRYPTPESMDQFNRSFWAEACRVEGKGRKIDIPNLPKTVDVGNDVIAPFDPQEVSLVDLGNMFPEMDSWVTQEVARIIDVNDNSDHFLAEMIVDAPHRNTTEGELCQQLEEVEEQQMSLKHYIIFGQTMHALTGKYPDRCLTWSMLGSCCGGATLCARFTSVGLLFVAPNLYPEDHDGNVGGRGERKI